MEDGKHEIKYEAIDGLRAFAALAIVVMHVLENGNYALSGVLFERVIPSFTDFVYLFMVISSFAMCCGYYDKIVTNKISWEQFYNKRYLKIWPYFALLCLLDFVVSPGINSLFEVFANLTLCFGFLPNANMSVIGVGWFLGLVFVFYIMFPFFCYLISTKKRAWFVFVGALIFNWLCGVYFGASRSNIVFSFVFFITGGLIFCYKECLEHFAEKYKWLLLIGIMVSAVVYFFVEYTIPIVIVFSSLLLIYSLGVKKNGILLNPVTKFLSSISLEIYLSHMMMFRILEKVNVTCMFKSNILSYVVTAIATIVMAIVFAFVSGKIIQVAGTYVHIAKAKAVKQKNRG